MKNSSFLFKFLLLTLFLLSSVHLMSQSLSLSIGPTIGVGGGFVFDISNHLSLPVELSYQEFEQTKELEPITYCYLPYDLSENSNRKFCCFSISPEYNRYIRSNKHSALFFYGDFSLLYCLKKELVYSLRESSNGREANDLLSICGLPDGPIDDLSVSKGLNMSVGGGIGIKFFYCIFSVNLGYQYVFGKSFPNSINGFDFNFRIDFSKTRKWLEQRERNF